MDIKKNLSNNKRPHLNTPTAPQAPRVVAPAADIHTPPQNKQTSPKRKYAFYSAACIFALGIAVFVWVTMQNSQKESGADEPTYPTVLPEGKTAATLGGWKRVSPPEEEAIYAYSDTIDDVAISVSQQTLPIQFQNNTDTHIANLAKSYKKLKTKSTTFYLGTNSKGPQSVIFTKEGLLILIKSEKTIADASWSAYIASLSNSSLQNIPKY